MSRAAEIEQVAAKWLLRREEPGWSATDEQGLQDWIEESFEHRVAFYRLEYGWRQADRLKSTGPAHSTAWRPLARRWWRPAGVFAAAAAIVVVVVSVSTPRNQPAPQLAFETRVGARETIPLADGSRVQMNTGTKVRAVVTRRHREVWLDDGEAFFEVAHDPAHPFVVHAGPRTITVLGTKFSVRREGQEVRVTVLEGKVRVDTSSAGSAAIAVPGDTVLAEAQSTITVRKPVSALADDLAWRQGRLTFEATTLADIVREFNRYNRQKLIVDDSAAGAVQITGSFDATNVDAFLRLIKGAYGLKVAPEGDQIRISN